MKAYELLDYGNGRKLENVGGIILIRPALNAFGRPALPDSEWDKAGARYERNSSGSGKWLFKPGCKLPPSWTASWGTMNMQIKATDFGHLGFFAEQHENWQWQHEIINELKDGEFNALNLFAYSGLGSLAMARAGAKVCHVDAARGMNEWAKENLELNKDVPDSIRWITDDVKKFLNRELRRNNQYQAIVFDPPSFGRGNKGQVWKITDDITPFLENCFQLLDEKKKCFMLFSCHSPGFSPLVIKSLLSDNASSFKFNIISEEHGEMTIPVQNSANELPAGSFCRMILRKM